MATINGFELKKIVNFKGHEGEPLIQADVYYNSKKVGTYCEDSWGGPDCIDIDPAIETLFTNYRSADLDDFAEDTKEQAISICPSFAGVGGIVNDLKFLNFVEKTYKSLIKKGFSGVAVVRQPNNYELIELQHFMTKDKTLQETAEIFARMGKVKIQDLTIYRDLSQFAANR